MRFLFARAAVLGVAMFMGGQVHAQSAASVSGRLLNSLSGDAIPGATVVIEELRRQTTSASREATKAVSRAVSRAASRAELPVARATWKPTCT